MHSYLEELHEVMHVMNTKKRVKPWMAIKLDMEKAYDRVDWDFILQSLKELGFDEKWITWIEQCIKNTITIVNY